MTNAPDFLPDYSSMPVNGRYRPLFKLLSTDNWRFVRKDGKPVEVDTAHQAIEAAKECVRQILNPEIRAEKAEAIADVLGVDQWRREKAGRTAGDQETVLGAVIVKGRQVRVERVRRRA